MSDSALIREMLDGRTKGIPGGQSPLSVVEIGRQGWNVLREDLPLPLAVLKQSALEQNSRWMRAFVDKTGVALCPHGKTTMSPQLHVRQLGDGAWGITLATVHQIQVARHFGISRILLANQLVGRQNIRFVLDELQRDAAFDFYCLVDSVDGVDVLAKAASEHQVSRPLQVLLELGVPSGRTGCRDIAQAREVAKAIRQASPHLSLRGFEGFEGVIHGDTVDDRVKKVRNFLGFMAEAARECGEYVDRERIILSAGGSVFFDLVIEQLRDAELTREPLIVLRSGCYLTGDDGLYKNAFENLELRSEIARSIHDPLAAGLEVWAYVQSRPEPKLAVLTLGRRDASFDAGLPAPKCWHRSMQNWPDESAAKPAQATAGRQVQPLSESHLAVGIHDQHLVIEVPESSPLKVGDLVGCGISHPCTTFDKWRMIPIVNDHYDVVDAITTFF